MAVIAPPKMTLEEFSNLPEGPPYFEFENGELVPMVSPTPEHQDGTDALVQVLKAWVRPRKLGRVFREIDLYLPDGRVYIPDITFLAGQHVEFLSPIDRKIHGVPDLVIEVMSSRASRDRIQKHRVYQNNNIPWYWIIDPRSLNIEEYHLTNEGYVRSASIDSGEDFQPRLFPGLTINLVSLLSEEAED